MGMDALGKLVSAEVRAMAGRKRWSAAALARELGWAQSYMARRWDGRAAFTPAELAQVARVLDVELDALLPAEARQVREVAGAEVLASLDMDQLERIAAALGVTVASLIPTPAMVAAGARAGINESYAGAPMRAGHRAIVRKVGAPPIDRGPRDPSAVRPISSPPISKRRPGPVRPMATAP